MKHYFIHNMLMLALAGAAIALSASLAVAQDAPPEPEETITVSTHVARVSVAVPQARKALRWEVNDNGASQGEFTVDAPSADNPLALTIVIDACEDRAHEWKYSLIGDQLTSLATELHLKQLPRVFVAGFSTTRFPFRWPNAWEISYLPDVSAAIREAVSHVEHGSGVRRALLVLTNRFEALPPHIFEDTDARLSHTAALVFIMSVAPQSNVASGARRVVAQGNLEMDANVSTSIDRYTPVFSFAQFVRTANSLHVVSYNLGDGEFAHAAEHLAEIKVVSARTGEILVRQRRRYRLEQ